MSDDGTSSSESLQSPGNAILTHQRTTSTLPFKGDGGHGISESVKTLNLDNFEIKTSKSEKEVIDEQIVKFMCDKFIIQDH